MDGTDLLVAFTVLLVLLGVVEVALHRRNLRRIPVRVHVNGTRGKSSVVRLVAAGLRAGGKVTCAKTTGTLARMILPDGREVPIYRPAGANVIEQKRIVAAAVQNQAEVLVLECMALLPELQSLCERMLVRATHGVITNARPDHLDVMGPGARDVALALAGMTPVRGRLYTAERALLDVFARSAADRGSELVSVGDEDIARVTAADLAGFEYTEHPDNVALALRVCADLGVDREVALGGMWRARPDPGAMTEHDLDFFGRRIVFVNGFAANDPVSTEQIWNLSIERYPQCRQRIAVFNCRADRADRSLVLGRAFPRWQRADWVVLMGTGTYLFARTATRAGLDEARLVFAEGLRVDELFERIVDLVEDSALVMGLGNVGGSGLDLTRFFQNRARPRPPRSGRADREGTP